MSGWDLATKRGTVDSTALPVDPAASDVRSSSAIRAWGCRRTPIRSADDASVRAGALHGYTRTIGQVNPRSLVAPPRLPATAQLVDPVVRQPMRHCGGWTALPAYHQHQGYYRRYGNAGRNAATSQHHNFPMGGRPVPMSVYSRDPEVGVNRCTKVRRPASAGPRPRVSACVGTADR